MVAKGLGIDRVEIRRRNLAAEVEIPFKLLTVLHPLNNQTKCDSGDYHATFERCLFEIRSSDKAKLQGRPIGERCHGLVSAATSKAAHQALRRKCAPVAGVGR